MTKARDIAQSNRSDSPPPSVRVRVPAASSLPPISDSSSQTWIFTKFFLALFFSLIVFADSSFAADSLAKLASIKDFAFGGIGYAGTTSEGELLFRDLYAKKTAKTDFGELLKRGNSQAKCYALVALRKLDPEAYRAQIERFSKVKDPVSTIGGCFIMVLPMNSVFSNINTGNYDVYLESKPK